MRASMGWSKDAWLVLHLYLISRLPQLLNMEKYKWLTWLMVFFCTGFLLFWCGSHSTVHFLVIILSINLHNKIKVSMMLNENETNGIHVLHIKLHYIASPSWYYRDQVKLQHSSGNQRQMVLPGWTRLHAASEEEKYGVQTKRTEDYPIQMSGGQRTDVHAKVKGYSLLRSRQAKPSSTCPLLKRE